ncbi:centrosomal protein of 131 kDa isoform X2 [Halyomorpha halys]|uniref:centrosomal protein of 131 kDa isoform X2 n=1 Tax=Halyomorpha halys TaxID=286706 RepID=UPI0034D2CC2E
MPLADAKERKQNEENNLLDFRLKGTQRRPSPVSSPSPSRLEPNFRSMSATPTFTYKEKHRKTPPWTRPQSADHVTRGRRKIAAKFERSGDRRHSKRKGTGSMNNLLDNSSIEDGIDSETSITPSPVPSLNEVLRSNGKLEPGLAAKPPIPPGLGPKREHKSMDDIINIKFQRWFPESIQEAYKDKVLEMNTGKIKLNSLITPKLKLSKSSENINDFHNSSQTPETQVTLSFPLHFDAYESPRFDSNKRLPKTHTMETIEESDDVPQVKINGTVSNYSNKNSANTKDREFMNSKVGQTLNQFYDGSDSCNQKKRVTIHENLDSEAERKNGFVESSNSSFVNENQISDAQNFSKSAAKTVEIGNQAEQNYPDSDTQERENLRLPMNGDIQRTGLNNEDILNWMGNSTEVAEGTQDKVLGSTTYNDIISMLKVLEKEEVESLKLEALSVNRSNNNSVCSNVTPVGASCRDILTFLDDLDRSDSRNGMHSPETKPVITHSEVAKPMPAGRMGQLLSLDSAELAQRVMALSLELEEKTVICDRVQERLKETQEKLNKHKTDSDSIIKRHQKFIDQLLQEKRLLGEQCASVVKEMEEKHNKTVASMESRHEVELKKLQEKMLAAEKLRREKWENERIKKIKEQTVKGLEPELERMTRTHQDELAELRRAHERELSEMEAASSRRIMAAREQALRDREQAVSEEREAARKKLEDELAEVERSYQEQRRRLMNEVRDEKERLEREANTSLAQRTRQLEEKWKQAEADLQDRMRILQEKHEAELKTLRETLEGERQSWLNHQAIALVEKEKQIRESVKKERDRHIEAVIRRLDEDAQEKERTLEAKIMRIKEEYERELKESEGSLHELKRKLKDARSETQDYEEIVSKLRTQTTQLECQLTTAKQHVERLEYERSESRSLARSEACSQIAALQRELSEERMKKEEAVALLQAEKERELQQVYNRVKEAIAKKDETVRMVQKQRDAALEQCAQLETMVDQQRKELSLRKQ